MENLSPQFRLVICPLQKTAFFEEKLRILIRKSRQLSFSPVNQIHTDLVLTIKAEVYGNDFSSEEQLDSSPDSSEPTLLTAALSRNEERFPRLLRLTGRLSWLK